MHEDTLTRKPPSPARGDWIALYGSLMRGLGPFDELDLQGALRFVGPCVLEGDLFDLGDYPGLCNGDGHVQAELYALLAPEVLSQLDEFEGYLEDEPEASLYLRERVSLVEPAETTAWVYRFAGVPEASMHIPSGDWRQHLQSRTRA